MTKVNLSDYDFELPARLIAKEPMRPRDHSRLLVLDQKNGQINHHTFYDLLDLLNPDDLLIMNDSKVFPARLLGQKASGGAAEILLDKQISDDTFEAIGKNLKVDTVITFPRSLISCYILSVENGVYTVRFNESGTKLFAEFEKIGQIPLPPYILKVRGGGRESKASDKKDYQTVYAKKRGSTAAPTAGLHFTDELLEKIKKKGVQIEKVTLHVGLGTFAPIKDDDLSHHQIHSEYFSVESSVWQRIQSAKKAGRRIVAVGTTTTRVFEYLSTLQDMPENNETPLRPILRQGYGRQEGYAGQAMQQCNNVVCNNVISGWTDIFITPGHKFKCVDALITNFHIPKSTLLLLVSALAGKENIKKAYCEAIASNYRFYSYGDAMLIQ